MGNVNPKKLKKELRSVGLTGNEKLSQVLTSKARKLSMLFHADDVDYEITDKVLKPTGKALKELIYYYYLIPYIKACVTKTDMNNADINKIKKILGILESQFDKRNVMDLLLNHDKLIEFFRTGFSKLHTALPKGPQSRFSCRDLFPPKIIKSVTLTDISNLSALTNRHKIKSDLPVKDVRSLATILNAIFKLQHG